MAVATETGGEGAWAIASHGARWPTPAGGVGAAAIDDMEEDLRRQPPVLEVDLDEPLYTQEEARRAIEQFKAIDYDEEIEVAPGINATFVDAGHILGSAIIRIRVADRAGEPERTIVFSGDLGRPDTPIIRDPTILTDADYILIESTYGGREHEPQDEAVRVLAETVRFVAEANGVLLVPSFAIGRTQEVVWQLDRLIDAGAIPLLPLYLDSPMASKASDIYRSHADYFDEETAKLLRAGGSPLDYPDQHVTRRVEESQAIAKAPRPYMIVASNGMLTGGRVVGHLRNLIGDPDATILFVGYQGEGTLGVPPPGRCQGSQDRRPAPRGPLPDPLDQRFLGPCRRVGAARLAVELRPRQEARRRGLSPPDLPRPRRPGGPDRDRAEGQGARLRDEDSALARTGRPRLIDARVSPRVWPGGVARRAWRVPWHGTVGTIRRNVGGIGIGPPHNRAHG